jgi:hypothetical protein
MKKLVLPALLVAALGPSVPASAGLPETDILSLNLSAMTASGSLGSVRQGGGPNDFLDCQIITESDSSPPLFYGECDANNGGGTPLECFTFSPTLISVIETIQSDSYIAFSGTSCINGQSTCCLASLTVYNGSKYPRLQP